jgi:hypothetical protein
MSGVDQRAGKLSLAGPALIAVSFQPAIPRRVAPQQSPLPLHRPTANLLLFHAGMNPPPANPCPQFRVSPKGCSPPLLCSNSQAPPPGLNSWDHNPTMNPSVRRSLFVIVNLLPALAGHRFA